MTDRTVDDDGRILLARDAALASPDVRDVRTVKDEDGRETFATDADAQAHTEAVAARNRMATLFLNDGDRVEVVVRVNGRDYKTVADAAVETSAGTQGLLLVRVRLMRDATPPPEKTIEPGPEREVR